MSDVAETPVILTSGQEETIAFNLCAVHGFDPDFVKTQRDFALAVIREYDASKPRLAPISAQPATDDALRVAVEKALEPFAAVAAEYDEREDDTFEVWKDAGPIMVREVGHALRLVNFRRAAKALAALKAETTNTAGLEVVATVVSAHGDPESFGERTIDVVANLSRIPYNTDLVTAASAQAAIDEERATKEAAYERIDIEMARAQAAEARADRLASAYNLLCEKTVDIDTSQPRLDEMATLVRMLVRHVPETKQIRSKALDYLSRHNLMGSPFRDGDALQQEPQHDRP